MGSNLWDFRNLVLASGPKPAADGMCREKTTSGVAAAPAGKPTQELLRVRLDKLSTKIRQPVILVDILPKLRHHPEGV